MCLFFFLKKKELHSKFIVLHVCISTLAFCILALFSCLEFIDERFSNQNWLLKFYLLYSEKIFDKEFDSAVDPKQFLSYTGSLHILMITSIFIVVANRMFCWAFLGLHDKSDYSIYMHIYVYVNMKIFCSMCSVFLTRKK